MIDFPTLILIVLVGLYLIGVAFLSALWAVAPDRPYWSKREAAFNWLLVAALWPVRFLVAAAVILWALISGYSIMAFEAVLRRWRARAS